jgi:hypothetical protein
MKLHVQIVMKINKKNSGVQGVNLEMKKKCNFNSAPFLITFLLGRIISFFYFLKDIGGVKKVLSGQPCTVEK